MMFSAAFQEHLENRFSIHIEAINPLSGGDINKVYLLKCKDNPYVLKVNVADKFPGMFKKESDGLQALRNTKVIDVPEVFGNGEVGDHSYLLMEYREVGAKRVGFWECFGEQMAALHQFSSDNFGFATDNYLGSLPQYNNSQETASEFYIYQRLEPQFKMAMEKGYKFKNLERFYKNMEKCIPNEKPALLHGDLWAGNFLVNSKGKPCLIDPAVSYGPREMDLAMMQLFGGFDNALFQTYDEVFKLEHGWKDRIQLWQLYYVLAHVNLFGAQYYEQAKRIVVQYS